MSATQYSRQLSMELAGMSQQEIEKFESGALAGHQYAASLEYAGQSLEEYLHNVQTGIATYLGLAPSEDVFAAFAGEKAAREHARQLDNWARS